MKTPKVDGEILRAKDRPFVKREVQPKPVVALGLNRMKLETDG